MDFLFLTRNLLSRRHLLKNGDAHSRDITKLVSAEPCPLLPILS